MTIIKNNTLLIFSTVLALGAGSALAQDATVETTTRGTVLSVPSDNGVKAPQMLPSRSMSKAAVRREFGNPKQTFPAVGEPPITRWDYPGFRVFFEYDQVLHAVVPGDFPSISYSGQLSPAR